MIGCTHDQYRPGQPMHGTTCAWCGTTADKIAVGATGGHAAPTAHHRHSDPDTSRAAALRAGSNVERNTWLLLGAHIAAGADGLTGNEHLAATGLPYSTIGPRRPWLAEAGWVADTGRRRAGQAVWIATDAGMAAWDARPEWLRADLDARFGAAA